MNCEPVATQYNKVQEKINAEPSQTGLCAGMIKALKIDSSSFDANEFSADCNTENLRTLTENTNLLTAAWNVYDKRCHKSGTVAAACNSFADQVEKLQKQFNAEPPQTGACAKSLEELKQLNEFDAVTLHFECTEDNFVQLTDKANEFTKAWNIYTNYCRGLSSKQIAGIVSGICLVILLLVALILFIFQRRNQ